MVIWYLYNKNFDIYKLWSPSKKKKVYTQLQNDS